LCFLEWPLLNNPYNLIISSHFYNFLGLRFKQSSTIIILTNVAECYTKLIVKQMSSLTAFSGWKLYDAGELSTIRTCFKSLPSLLRSWKTNSKPFHIVSQQMKKISLQDFSQNCMQTSKTKRSKKFNNILIYFQG